MTPRHAPHATLEGHLTFALKYEGLDLAVSSGCFMSAGPAIIEAIVRGNADRRLRAAHLVPLRMADRAALGLAGCGGGTLRAGGRSRAAIRTEGENAPRYRVRNNLPGTPEFCPLVFRTDKLEAA